MKKAYIVSPEYPSGSTWLWNVLLELNIRVSPSAYPACWMKSGDGYRLKDRAQRACESALPALLGDAPLEFRDDLDVESHHRLAFVKEPNAKFIVVTRDAREALISDYLRCYFPRTTLLEYLTRPEYMSRTTGGITSGMTGLFHLPPPETWAYFQLVWRALSPILPVFFHRFEDSKTRPIEAVREVLAFLEVERSEEEIVRATERTSFDAAKEKIEASVGFSQLKRGVGTKWPKYLGPFELSQFSGVCREALEASGYDPSAIPACPELPPLFDHAGADPELIKLVENAFAAYLVGDSIGAEFLLWRALAERRSQPEKYVVVASAIAALHWTRTIVGEAANSVAVAETVLQELFRLNSRYAHTPGVQHALSALCRYYPMEFISEHEDISLLFRGRVTNLVSPTEMGVSEFEASTFEPTSEGSGNPERVKLLLHQAAVLIDRQSHEEALTVCNEILRLVPYSAEVHFLKGLAFNYLGATAKAVVELNRAMLLAPHDNRNGFALMVIHVNQSDAQRARQAIEELLTWMPNDLQALRSWIELLPFCGMELEAPAVRDHIDRISADYRSARE